MSGRRIIAGMATLPSRAGTTLLPALLSLLHQVDRLYLYLDGHQASPVTPDRVVPILARDVPHLHDAGKFFGLTLEDDCIYLSADDDILYPRDYVQAILAGLEEHKKAAVGFHGSTFHAPIQSYESDRTVTRFEQGCAAAHPVHMLGTGAAAFDSRTLRFDVRRWPHANMSDLYFALACAEARAAMICLARPPFFLRALASGQPDSIAVTRTSDRREVEMARTLCERLP